MRATLRRGHERAARGFAELPAPEAPVWKRVVESAAVRPHAPAGAVRVGWVEAVVCLAVAAYFVAGLIGVLVA